MRTIQEIIAIVKDSSSWLLYRRAEREIQKFKQDQRGLFNTKMKVAVLSSFTAGPLKDYLVVEAAKEGIDAEIYMSGFGQVSPEILNQESGLYAFEPDVTIIVATADSFAHNPFDAVEELIKLSAVRQERGTGILVVNTFMALPDWPLHLLETDRHAELKKANDKLRETFSNNYQVQICDLDTLAAYYGYANALSPQMQAMAHIPFSEGFLVLLAKKFVSYLKAQAGLVRKCLVLDCDNTLWGGIIGEDGMDGIALGPDWPGREFVDFQKAILELYQQGVILAINSKNNYADVTQVLREHPHMILKEEHFAGICVNWNSKPDNMKTLADEINIGLDSFVFIDDNPAERQMMRQMLPEVEVLELSDNPALYAKSLRETNFFAKASLTEEDKKRGQIYAAQRRRNQLQQSAATLEDYLKSLEMVCSIRAAEEKDVKRAAQLTQRTNQFNLTARRYTETEIQHMIADSNWNVYVLGLRDKFGDNGTVGLALLEKHQDVWRVDTFLMSCRVIGRQVEEAFVNRICFDAVNTSVKRLGAEYIRTKKNILVSDFWGKMNFSKDRSDENTTYYHYDLDNYTSGTFEHLKFE